MRTEILVPCVWSLALFAMIETTFASATRADFEKCHKLAAATLEQCLNSHASLPSREICWQQARKANEQCYAEVHKTYSPAESDRRRRAIDKATKEHSG